MAFGVQVVFRAVDDRLLAPTPAARRAFTGVMLRVGERHGLYGCGLADSHGHAALAGVGAGRFVQAATQALSHALGVELVKASVWPIRDVWHAENVLAYVHRQDQHHGVQLDPLREGTTLPALLGLRVDGLWLPGRLRTLVPRVTRADLLAQWGIAGLAESVALEHLASSAAAAVGRPALRGRDALVVAARRAAVHACPGTTTLDIAAALALPARTVRKLREHDADSSLVRAVRLQMGLRSTAPTPRSLLVDSGQHPFEA